MDNTESENFLTLNTLLYGSAKKYIWINDSNEIHEQARQLFGFLLKKKIYIDGFVTDAKALINLKMFHKKIVDINLLKEANAAIFYDFLGRPEKELIGKGHSARIMNFKIDGGKIIIWGAGLTGECVCNILNQNGIKAECFVDSNEELSGKLKQGIPIYSPDKLDEFAEDIIIIEALEKWRELDEVLRQKYKKRFHYSLKEEIRNQWSQVTCDIFGNEKIIFELNHFWKFSNCEGRKTYIYGTGNMEREFAEYLKLLDYNFAGFLVTEMDCEYIEDMADYVYIYVEELLYESDYYVWAFEKAKAEKLEELGLRYLEDYFCDKVYFGKATGRKDILDVNLGNNYIAGSKYPGIVVYGEARKEDYRIAILGASTTDGAIYSFQSWPEILYQELKDNNITIYNGGVSGYTSGQELIKLIRDMIPLRPDMIIVYDGHNDTAADVQYPFAFSYAKKIYDYAGEHLEDVGGEESHALVCCGAVVQENLFDNWVSNIRSMHAIAKDREISFYSFCMPVLFSKRGKTEKEKNMLISAHLGAVRRQTEMSFRNFMNKMQNKPEYMYDLSFIFDEQRDVYIDTCHVWEKGNRIIAEEIKKIILPALNNSRVSSC